MRSVRLDTTTETPTLRIKGKVTDGSAIYLGTCLEQAARAGAARLKLDFGAVRGFDYPGVVFLIALLQFYAKDFEDITCYALPKNIASVFRGLGLEKTGGVRIGNTKETWGNGVRP
jgi:ABC-type transporter Mla MlaB component